MYRVCVMPSLPATISAAPSGAESEAGQYFKDQYGLENLSHHMLPLLRYRRKKYRMLEGYYAPELTAVHAKTLPAK